LKQLFVGDFFDKLNIERVNEELFFDSLILEIPIEIKSTTLDSEMLKLMANGSEMIKRVFSLADFEGCKKDISNISHLNTQISFQSESSKKNFAQVLKTESDRKAWLNSRMYQNEKRKERKLEPLPLSEVERTYPKVHLTQKGGLFTDIYKCRAQSESLQSSLIDEKLKLESLMALADKKQ
jgi:hypothetical protein